MPITDIPNADPAAASDAPAEPGTDEVEPNRETAEPVSAGASDSEDDVPIYRVPDSPPDHGTVRIDQKDGTVTYTRSLDGNGSD